MNKRFTISFDNTTIAFATKSTRELIRTRWIFVAMNSEMCTKIGTFLIKSALLLRIPIKFIIKQTIFKQFCGGETLDECLVIAKSLQKSNIGVIPDYSVEGEKSELAFNNALVEILNSIRWVHLNDEAHFSVFKCTSIGRGLLLQKVQKNDSLSTLEMVEFEQFINRFDQICDLAFNLNVKLLVDAEESWIQTVIDDLTIKAMEKYNIKEAIVYNTFQMYRVDKLSHLQHCYELALAKGYYLGVKLVRGAYLEKENAFAIQHNIATKVHKSKNDTDRSFNAALAFCCLNIPFVYLCAGSHNEKSNELLAKLMLDMENEYISRICFAQLYGMGDHISYNLSITGYKVVKYLPYGSINKVLPYLFRRAEENKSINGQANRELMLIETELFNRKNDKK